MSNFEIDTDPTKLNILFLWQKKSIQIYFICENKPIQNCVQLAAIFGMVTLVGTALLLITR